MMAFPERDFKKSMQRNVVLRCMGIAKLVETS